MRRALRVCAALLVALGLGGCATGSAPPPVQVASAPAARTVALQAVTPPLANGAIFRPGVHRGLFEDRRARGLGDTINIAIRESIQASQSNGVTVNRTASAQGGVSAFPFMRSALLGRLNLEGGSDNKFSGNGEANSNNTFNGTITATVTEVLPNGHLVVSGEKQVGINRNVEVLRFSGIVDPASIQPDNSVPSTRVADARIQVQSEGDTGRAAPMGWLHRLLMSFSPL